jgi:hypothetical protein
MATITNTKLTIAGSPEAGKSVVTVTYDVVFDIYDDATDQPYLEKISLFGVDSVSGEDGTSDYLAQLILYNPDHPTPYIVKPSMIVSPATKLSRSHFQHIDNSILNEDKLGVPNPDEIQATVTLTPRFPTTVSAKSNIVTLVLS